MSLNFLQKSLARLSESQGKFKTARSTEFVRHINKAVTDLSEEASSALEQTEAAYNKYLEESDQPVSNEIKDLQNYAKNLSKKPLKIDIANSPAVNKTLAEEIDKDNEEAYRLIKRSKNPFVSKRKKLDESNELAVIKNKFKVYKKDKDIINELYSNAIEVQKNPDPHPSKLEIEVHAKLMDGSFKDEVVWNPTIDGEKQLGGYYMYEGKYIKLEDLKTVNKVDLEFETQMAEFVNDARKLGAANNWNDDSRREVISGMINLAKSNPSALRPIIFGGFTADKTQGAESAYATTWLDKLLADEKLTFTTPAQRDVMLDVLKDDENLTDAFLNYFTDFIDNNAKATMALNNNKPNNDKKSGAKFGANAINEFNNFVESYNLPAGSLINIPGTSLDARRLTGNKYQIIEKGNPVTLANQKPYLVSEEELLTMAELPKPYREKLKKQKVDYKGIPMADVESSEKLKVDDFKPFANQLLNK